MGGGGGGVEGSPYNGERTFCRRWFVDDVLCVGEGDGIPQLWQL